MRQRHHSRIATLALLAAMACDATAQAVPDPDAFRRGVAYEFERKFATRRVTDAADSGLISLATYIYRPLRDDRRQVAVFLHGSLGGMTVDPHEQFQAMPRELIEYLVRKGITVVYSTRRGIGESSGTFREECAFAAGACTLAQYRAMFQPGIAEAEADTLAVIDELVLGKEVPRDAKVLLVGISRGGFLALHVAAQRPGAVSGVLNFVGGWLSLGDDWPVDENAERLRLQRDALARIGQRLDGVPTQWVYASRDPFYAESTTRGFFASFTTAGGRGDYLFVDKHELPSGHSVATRPALWSAAVDAFLGRLR